MESAIATIHDRLVSLAVENKDLFTNISPKLEQTFGRVEKKVKFAKKENKLERKRIEDEFYADKFSKDQFSERDYET